MIEQHTAQAPLRSKTQEPAAQAPALLVSFASKFASGIWVEIHEGLAGIEADWRSFEERARCTVFQRYDYLAAWQLHIGSRNHARPLVLVIRGHGEEILCIAPFAILRHGKFNKLTWLGQANSDYCAPLLASGLEKQPGMKDFPAVWDEVVSALERDAGISIDLVDLRKMPEAIGGEPNPFLLLPHLPNPSNAHLARLGSEWETFYADKRSSATRRRDRTKRKKLGEIGDVKMITPSVSSEIETTLEKLVEQKSAALLNMGVANLFAEPGVREFYLELATGPRTCAFTHVSKLMVGDCQASSNLGFEHAGRYYYVLASYEAGEVSRFGPGAAHLRDLMQRAIERGLKEFDFTIGDERYKSEWSDTETRLYDHLHANSWRATPSVWAGSLNTRLRRMIKQNAWAWSMVLRIRAAFGRGRTAPPAATDSDK